MIPSLDIMDLPWKLILFIGIFFALRTYMRGVKYNNLEKLHDKVVIVTGANSGIGYETAKKLLCQGAKVVITCRSLEICDKTRKQILEEIKIPINEKLLIKCLDLNSFESIYTFAKEINNEFKKVDILINNAGLMMHPLEYNDKGIEVHFMVNYLGPFLLTCLLLSSLVPQTTDKSHIVNVVAPSYKMAKLNLNSIKKSMTEDGSQQLISDTVNYGPREFFAQSKLAIVLGTKTLSEKLKDRSINVNACIPGICFTNIMRYLPFFQNNLLYILFCPFLWFLTKTASDGAQIIVFSATDNLMESVTGNLICEFKPQEIVFKNLLIDGDDSNIEDKAEELWIRSLEMCNLKESQIFAF